MPSRASRRACASSLTFLLVVLCGTPIVLPRAFAEDMPPISSTAHHFLLPIEGSRGIYRFAQEGPQPVLDFWNGNGREWRVHWDAHLETPRFVYPLAPVRVAEPEPTASASQPRPEFVRSVEAFIDRNAAFFGASSATLSDPYVYPLAGTWVLVFEETTPGGIPIRGANSRIVMGEDGTFQWASAFLARGVVDPAGPLLSKEEVESAASIDGSVVESSSLQMGFASTSVASATPIWALWVRDAANRLSEHIRDAVTGTVLARRSAEKHFDGGGAAAFTAQGVVQATCPDLRDIFVGPETPNDHLIHQPVPGILIRDHRFEPLVLTNPAGEFVADVETNPATLNASLETRSPEANGLVPLLKIEPIDQTFALGVPDALDLDGDETPDLSQTHTTDEKFTYELFGDARLPLAQKEVNWWLQTYEHATKVLQFADRVVRIQLVAADQSFQRFLPIRPIVIRPQSDRSGIQTYEPHANDPSEILSSWSLRVIANGLDIVEDVLPTFLQHEVGHHIVFHMTNCVNSQPESLQLEEALADVITAYTNQQPEIGFRRDSSGDTIQSQLGFDLSGHDRPDFRSAERVDVGESFWRLRDLMREQKAEPGAAQSLLFAWLAAHRCFNETDTPWDNSHNLFEELLLIDDTPRLFKGGDGDPSNGTPHEKAIIQAFQHKSLFDAPFSRGDATIDGKLDISDAVGILVYLFRGDSKHDCKNAMDADNNGKVEITDAVRILGYLFLGRGSLPSPFLGCGMDLEALGDSGNLGCRDFACPM